MCVCIAGRRRARSGAEFGEVDILHRPEMSGAPPLPPPRLFTTNPPVLLSHLFILSGHLFFLPANRCCCCHLLYFMCLEHGSLSAPNASVSVSPLLSTDTVLSSQKGKTPLHHSPVDAHTCSGGRHVGVPLFRFVCACSRVFPLSHASANEMKKHFKASLI